MDGWTVIEQEFQIKQDVCRCILVVMVFQEVYSENLDDFLGPLSGSIPIGDFVVCSTQSTIIRKRPKQFCCLTEKRTWKRFNCFCCLGVCGQS